MLRTNSIPIILLTGFLGAGKTSLLNHLLRNKDNFKIGVIVNDFGKINVDALLVEAQTDTTLELSNGCICCSLEDEGLDDALGQLAHRGSRLDYIIIEASGLAEVKELLMMLKMIKSNYCHFDLLVNIVDAENFEKNNQQNVNALDDLQISDLIILNKVDLINEEKFKDIQKAISLAAPRSRLLKTEHGRVDARLLFDTEDRARVSQQVVFSDHQHGEEHKHLHDQFTSLDFQTPQALDPQKFENWAKKLDPSIFRAKGVVFFGMKGAGQKFIFQAVGQRYQLKLAEWDLGQTPTTQLVVIGLGLDKDRLQAQLEGLIDDQPDNISKDTLMDIFMYK